jgi:hypothetical protein
MYTHATFYSINKFTFYLVVNILIHCIKCVPKEFIHNIRKDPCTKLPIEKVTITKLKTHFKLAPSLHFVWKPAAQAVFLSHLK